MTTIILSLLLAGAEDDKWGVELVPCNDGKQCVSYADYDALAEYLVSIEDANLELEIPAIHVMRDADGRAYVSADSDRIRVRVGPVVKTVQIDLTKLVSVVESPPKPCPVCVPRWSFTGMPALGVLWNQTFWFQGCAGVSVDLPYGPKVGKWMGLSLSVDPCIVMGTDVRFSLTAMVGTWFRFGT